MPTAIVLGRNSREDTANFIPKRAMRKNSNGPVMRSCFWQPPPTKRSGRPLVFFWGNFLEPPQGATKTLLTWRLQTLLKFPREHFSEIQLVDSQKLNSGGCLK